MSDGGGDGGGGGGGGGDGGGDGGDSRPSLRSSPHLTTDDLSSLPPAFRPSPPPTVRATSPTKPPDERKESPPIALSSMPIPSPSPPPHHHHLRFAPFSPPHHPHNSALHRAASTPAIPPLLSPTRQRSDVAPSSSPQPPDDGPLPTPRKKPHQPLLLHSSLLPANVYVQQRVGSILSRSMILKSDHFSLSASSGAPAPALDLHLLGAPNMQQIRPFFIFGVGQPTISGVRTLLNLIKAKQPHHRHVQWICLREGQHSAPAAATLLP